MPRILGFGETLYRKGMFRFPPTLTEVLSWHVQTKQQKPIVAHVPPSTLIEQAPHHFLYMTRSRCMKRTMKKNEKNLGKASNECMPSWFGNWLSKLVQCHNMSQLFHKAFNTFSDSWIFSMPYSPMANTCKDWIPKHHKGPAWFNRKPFFRRTFTDGAMDHLDHEGSNIITNHQFGST